MTRKKLVVIGAGPTGITAAFYAQKKGFEVTLLEKEKYIGGKCASIKRNNFIGDFGPHAYHPLSKEINSLVKSHAKENYIQKPLNLKLIIKNKTLSYPFRINEGFTKFNPFFTLKILRFFSFDKIAPLIEFSSLSLTFL